ncbi:DNA polymerase III subunit epsilon [Robiginitomaculum antarcticum]|uniref:DNA polymerase III subunit epsilon n=1 Tax=Robiginitomaculum antarcticum TaxID=437507 RepID=UPI00035E5CFE|nr:DNA polymerase III subunit epsilon [Robiginitomaculum antarcticum]
MTRRAKNPGREIVFDTETTGFDAKGEDRITEIGCIELIDYLPTGKSFHRYCDPLREVPERVVEITGLTTEFLSGKPLFKDVAQDFLDFIGEAPLIAHNSDFDRGFVNAELGRAGFSQIPTPRFVDTLKMARAKFPGSPATLDALCKRFDISLASRDKHGAITDSILLAEVYLELSGGRARRLGLDDFGSKPLQDTGRRAAPQRPAPLPLCVTHAEKTAHEAFIESLGDSSIWRKFRRI